jgi:hypothetical protein
MQLGIVMGVEIDKSRGDNQPAGIDHLGCIVAIQATNFGNLAILDAEVRAVSGHPRPIDNRAVFNNGIKLWHNSSFEVGLSVDWIVY